MQFLKARKMHFQGGKFDPLGCEAVADRVVVQVVPQHDH
jgi:hypothetical protein